VANGIESQRVLGFLRYVRSGSDLTKHETEKANRFLERHHPDYLFHSPLRDVQLHGVPLERIALHYRPAMRLGEIMDQDQPDDLVDKVRFVAPILGHDRQIGGAFGVTGSILVSAYHPQSDIDFVVYGRDNFRLARRRLQQGIESGHLDELTDSMWKEAYRRRGCSLTFHEFLWHEKRKFNKCAARGTKVDVNGIVSEQARARSAGKKLRAAVITATVNDASAAFDYPAVYGIDHREISEIVCFTPTYAGQAVEGERVEAAGWLERPERGDERLTIGTSREAVGQYLKVLSAGGR
jgi:predicted nucleotidyltransferase